MLQLFLEILIIFDIAVLDIYLCMCYVINIVYATTPLLRSYR